MSNESVSVSGPVSVQMDSKERVALELAEKIDHASQLKYDQKDRQYWLTLYSQCLSVVRGGSVACALGKE